MIAINFLSLRGIFCDGYFLDSWKYFYFVSDGDKHRARECQDGSSQFRRQSRTGSQFIAGTVIAGCSGIQFESRSSSQNVSWPAYGEC